MTPGGKSAVGVLAMVPVLVTPGNTPVPISTGAGAVATGVVPVAPPAVLAAVLSTAPGAVWELLAAWD